TCLLAAGFYANAEMTVEEACKSITMPAPQERCLNSGVSPENILACRKASWAGARFVACLDATKQPTFVNPAKIKACSGGAWDNGEFAACLTLAKDGALTKEAIVGCTLHSFVPCLKKAKASVVGSPGSTSGGSGTQ